MYVFVCLSFIILVVVAIYFILFYFVIIIFLSTGNQFITVAHNSNTQIYIILLHSIS